MRRSVSNSLLPFPSAILINCTNEKTNKKKIPKANIKKKKKTNKTKYKK